MTTRTRSLLSLCSLLLILAAMVGMGAWLAGSRAAAAPPAGPAVPEIAQAQSAQPASVLPLTTCSEAGGTRTCHLWAKTGSITMPDGAVLPIWGFAETDVAAAQVPGPMIIANQGETLEVVLHNQLLTETVSLAFPGQPGVLPDMEGVASGGTRTYTFALTEPGTFLYEAGLTPHGTRQVAMGMAGALIVRPTGNPTWAYDNPATAFTDEALVVMNDFDPALNYDPYGFRIQNYAPRYWLINGLAYPQTLPIDTIAGNTVLLRYLNAGLEVHGMGLLGLRQQIIASDGGPRGQPYWVVAEKIAAGQTLDTLTMVPPETVEGTQYAVYNTNLMLHNAGQRVPATGPLAYGGMLTFLNTVTGTLPEDGGPQASLVAVDPNPTNGALGVTLSAHLDDSPAGGQNVVAAEFFTNTVGTPGTGTAFSVVPGVAVDVSYLIPAAALAGWPGGWPAFYVRGQDADGNWGPVGSVVLNLDKVGPHSTGLSLWREPTNGTRSVLLRATGDDHHNGGSNVIAGEYSLDGAPAEPMFLNHTDQPFAAMTATIPSAALAVIDEGRYPVAVRSQDSFDNWGVPSIITLTLDKTGPTVASVSLTPNYLDLSGAPPVTKVRLRTNITDTLSANIQSPLANAEGFIDVVGPNGTGFPLFPSDGLFDEVGEWAYFDIPIVNFLWLAQGTHQVWTHGLDVAGNWGPVMAGTIEIYRADNDTQGPVVSGASASPNPTGGAQFVTLSAGAADPQLLSNISSAEWWIGNGPHRPLQAADGAFDSPVEQLTAQIDVSTWAERGYTLNLRARDTAMIWGPTVTVRLQVGGATGALLLADGFEAGNLNAWTEAIGPVSVTPAAAIAPDGGTLGMQAVLGGAGDAVEPAYVSHILPPGEANYRASFYFDPNSTEMLTDSHDIFVGLTGETLAPMWGIEVEAAGDPSPGYEVRAWALSDGVRIYTQWYDISDAPHQFAIAWKAGHSTTFSLAIDGTVVEVLAEMNTSAYLLHGVRLGPSGELNPGLAGVEYFDAFRATRSLIVYLPMIVRAP